MMSVSRFVGKAISAAVFGAWALWALATPAAAQQAISVGQSVQGALAQGDSTLSQGEFVDSYAFQGRAGQTITVRMSSSAVDSYVVIVGPNNYGEENDDEASGSLNAGLTVTLPANGAYMIMATSLNGGETGSYTLQVTGGGSAPQAVNSPGGAIQAGQTVRGSLANGDTQLNSGEFADTYTYSGRAGQSVTIDLGSSEFDTYLMVRGTNLQEDNDDDPAARGSTNSQLTVTVPSDGRLTIRPTSYQPGETGAYTLSVRESGGGAQQAMQAPEGSGSIRVGQSANGRLQQGDGMLSSGEFRDTFTLDGRRGQQLEVRLESGDFDPYVAIVGPSEFSAFNDDDTENGTRNSRMLVTLPEDGPYIIMATSYASGETGAYRLTVAETNDVAPGQGSSSTADALQIGRTINGALAQGDTTLRSGEFTDSYSFRGQAGQRVTIDMASSAFDTYVMLVAPSGAQEDNDDAPGGSGGTNSQLDTVLAESGDYTVIATSYRAGETGAYTMRVNAGGATQAASGPVRRGRVFALMVGISDYQGFANNLDYTNEDAVKMGEALRRAGVLADQSIVLTDGQATRANVIAAFQRVAAQAGPNDTFLFFFSGHGTQTQAAAGANEPDARDESIVMVDGLISDDEMAQLYSTVHAGTSLIALDSCFSGGFARDVVANPGVMGLFSSEEDLTSAVADKFQAGGYLSLFLRNGLGGEADSNRNGVITAGELSVYMRQQFAENAQNVESSTMEGQRNYQFLVVDRGGVRVDDQVIALRS